MNSAQRLLLQNKAWAAERLRNDKDFFNRHLEIQTPEFLWIGCSDSRVPANEITGTDPGEIFVHRNIANMVVHTDLNLLSVVQYAVQVLKVKTVIVCGHSGCGGVKAALTNKSYGLLNKWLRNIKDNYRIHENELNGIKDEEKKLARMIELNVCEQVNNLAKTSIVQQAWQNSQLPVLLGWVYNIETGVLDEVCRVDYTTPQNPIYKYEF